MKDSIHKNPSVKQSSREILPPRVFHMRMRNAACQKTFKKGAHLKEDDCTFSV